MMEMWRLAREQRRQSQQAKRETRDAERGRRRQAKAEKRAERERERLLRHESRQKAKARKARRKHLIRILRRSCGQRALDKTLPRGSWLRAWMDRDVANVYILDSQALLVRFVRTRHSRMTRLWPEDLEQSCWWPRATASARLSWLILAPIGAAMVAYLVAYMLLLFEQGWGWVPVLAALAAGIIGLRIGFWAGLRAIPKPTWVLRRDGDGALTPLAYDHEWIDGTVGPRHVFTTAQKLDVRALLSGASRDWRPGIVPVAGVVTGIGVTMLVLFLVFVTGRQDDPAVAAASAPQAVATAEAGPLPAFPGTSTTTKRTNGDP